MRRALRKNAARVRCRRGAAAVELALMLPLLSILFCGAMDFARVYYYTQIVADCARTGAMYAANPDQADETEYDSPEEATLSAAADLSPTPAVVVANACDGDGNECVAVTVRYSFPMFTSFIGVPSPLTVSRTVFTRLYPSATSP